jgi:hypothetical protein
MGLEVETQPLNDGWACRADIVIIIVLVIIYIVHYDIVIVMVVTKYHCFVMRCTMGRIMQSFTACRDIAATAAALVSLGWRRSTCIGTLLWQLRNG